MLTAYILISSTIKVALVKLFRKETLSALFRFFIFIDFMTLDLFLAIGSDLYPRQHFVVLIEKVVLFQHPLFDEKHRFCSACSVRRLPSFSSAYTALRVFRRLLYCANQIIVSNLVERIRDVRHRVGIAGGFWRQNQVFRRSGAAFQHLAYHGLTHLITLRVPQEEHGAGIQL